MNVFESLRRISNIVILLCAIVQAYVDGVNSKIFCFLFGFVWTRCVLLFLLLLLFTESILTAFSGLFYSFEQNSTVQCHYSLSTSSCVSRCNNFGSDI